MGRKRLFLVELSFDNIDLNSEIFEAQLLPIVFDRRQLSRKPMVKLLNNL